MGRRGLIQTFTPLRLRESHPWRTPPTRKASFITPRTRSNVQMMQANLDAQKPQEEEAGFDQSVYFSTLFPSLGSLENATETTVDVMSSMSHELFYEMKEDTAKVLFDFDPDLVLHQKKYKIPLRNEVQSHLECGSIPSDLEVQIALRYDQSGYQRNEPHRIACVEENHNEYIARKFNRKRIEFYLDLLCPPDKISEDASYQEQMQKVPIQISSPYLPKKYSEEWNEGQRVIEESKSKLSNKSFEGFSLKATESHDSKGKHMESSGYLKHLTLDDYDELHCNNVNEGLDFNIYSSMSCNVPSTIHINLSDQLDEEITLGSEIDEIDEGEIINHIRNVSALNNELELSLPHHHSTEHQSNHMMIQHSDTYDTANSPTGIEEFELAVKANSKVSSRLKSPDNIMSINYFTQSDAVSHEKEQYHCYQPMAVSLHHNISRMIHENKEKVDHLRSRSNRITKLPSSQSASVKSCDFRVTYNSKNIMKLKSRMREIENKYGGLRVPHYETY